MERWVETSRRANRFLAHASVMVTTRSTSSKLV
jgi:hypothetical protein